METIDDYKWKVQIKGERCSKSWEISVVRIDNALGQRSWGWFGEDKLLVSHNGGPCRWPICGLAFDAQIIIANEMCRRLNNNKSIERIDMNTLFIEGEKKWAFKDI